MSLLWVILCVVVIILLAYWFTKYVAARGGTGIFGASKGSGQLKVLARQSVGKDQALLLVQVGERYFLLGAAASAISTLAEFTQEEADAWPEPPQRPASPDFREALRTVFHQKRQR